MRHLGGAIKNWEHLLEQAFRRVLFPKRVRTQLTVYPSRTIKPGGWVHICEFDINFYSDDGTLTPDSCITTWSNKVQEATQKLGRLFITETLPSLLERAGFEHVHSKSFKQPVGTWAKEQKLKEIGAFTQLLVDTGFEALGIALFTRVLGMEVEDAEALIKGCKTESKNKKIHSYATQ